MKKLILLLSLTCLLNDFIHAQWTSLSSGTNEFLPSISFPSANTGYCISETGIIHKTTNGGTNWNTLTTLYSFKIHFNDDLTGFTYGGNDIFKTSDGGQNWISKLSIDPTESIDGLFFLDQNIGYATSANFMDSLIIFKTTDGGENWIRHSFDLNYLAYVNTLFFIDANTGFIGNWDGQILKTTDGGLNWNLVYSSAVGMLNQIIFTSSTNGFAIAEQEFLKTTDGGDNWMASTPPFSGLYAAMDITPDGTIHVTGGNGFSTGTLIKSTNNGNTWTQTGTSSQSYYGVCFVNDSIGYTSGTNGSILKFGSSNLGLVDNKQDFIHVYPNPVATHLNIENINGVELKSIQILNSLGEEILGFHSNTSTIDFTSLPSGIYILEIETMEGIVRKKIIRE